MGKENTGGECEDFFYFGELRIIRTLRPVRAIRMIVNGLGGMGRVWPPAWLWDDPLARVYSGWGGNNGVTVLTFVKVEKFGGRVL